MALGESKRSLTPSSFRLFIAYFKVAVVSHSTEPVLRHRWWTSVADGQSIPDPVDWFSIFGSQLGKHDALAWVGQTNDDDVLEPAVGLTNRYLR